MSHRVYIGDYKKCKKKEGCSYVLDVESKALIECNCTIQGCTVYLKSVTNEIEVNRNISLLKSSFSNIKEPLLKKYGISIKIYDDENCKHHIDTVEIYFCSILIREDWLSCFLRFSLPETICSGVYDGEDESDKIFVPLPLLLMVPDYQVRPLLWRKLRICCVRLNLEDEHFSNEIRIRYDTIQELINICEIGDGDLFSGLGTLEDCFRMLSYVLFRSLPFPERIEYNALDMEIPFLDPEWEYLELVHDFFLKLVTCPHIRIDNLRSVISTSFLRNYTYLLLSQDARERSIVQLGVHHLYSRLCQRRGLIRHVFSEMLSNIITLNDRVVGVEEILTIYNSIVCGFVLPIRREHVQFLKHCILPLHKLNHLPEFSGTLTNCLLLFISRDHDLVVPIIQGMLRYWPKYSTQCEIVILDELEKIITSVDPSSLHPVFEALMIRLRRCINSDKFLVAERTLKLWDNKEFAEFVLHQEQNMNESWHVLSGAVTSVSKNSWNLQLRKDACRVASLYSSAEQCE